MQGAPISRWTMAYFAAALTVLIGGLAAMGGGFGIPSPVVDAPETLAVVHTITIGWLGLLFCGALLQFVPVLAATHLRMPWLAAPALLLLISGLASLTTGFLALGGYVAIDPAIMVAGAALLAMGFACVVVPLAATILSQKSFDIPAALVLAGLIGLIVTMVMGNVFAGLLSGVLDVPGLASRLSTLVPYHAASGTLGWMTLTAIGVSYRLFAMFMLSPEGGGSHRLVVVTAILALAALHLSFVLGLFDIGLSNPSLIVSIALATLLLGLYCRDIWRMFRARRRKGLELNSLAGLAALGFLVAGIALLAGAVLVETDLPLGVAAFYLLGMGWLSGLGLAQLYKIVPFLTWLETYGPVMGRSQVPRVQDLVDERGARAWFGVFYLSVCTGAVAILFGLDPVFRAASWGQCIAVVALALEYLRARRLAYVPISLRLPPGANRPHLIHATVNSKE